MHIEFKGSFFSKEICHFCLSSQFSTKFLAKQNKIPSLNHLLQTCGKFNVKLAAKTKKDNSIGEKATFKGVIISTNKL